MSWIFTHRLFKTQRTLTFDVIVIGSESLRILLIIAYEFFYDHMIMLMLCYFVETILRAIVCSNFVSKVMILRGLTPRQVRVFRIVYYSIISSLIATVLALSLTDAVQLDCENLIYSYHWFILDTIDTIQSVLILMSARKLRRFLEEQIYMKVQNPASSLGGKPNEKLL